MRRYLMVAAVAGVALLAGCGSDPGPVSGGESLASSVAAVVPSGQTLWTDEEFADQVRSDEHGFYELASTESIVKVAKSMCAAFDPTVGNEWTDLIDVLVESGVEPEEAGGFVTLATYQYCPEKGEWLPGV